VERGAARHRPGQRDPLPMRRAPSSASGCRPGSAPLPAPGRPAAAARSHPEDPPPHVSPPCAKRPTPDQERSASEPVHRGRARNKRDDEPSNIGAHREIGDRASSEAELLAFVWLMTQDARYGEAAARS
jgi:hypothetical protein